MYGNFALSGNLNASGQLSAPLIVGTGAGNTGTLSGNWTIPSGGSLTLGGTDSLTTVNITSGSNTTPATLTGAWTVNSNLTVSGTLTNQTITTGANTTTGNITGTWTLTAGSTLNATYADLAERFEADAVYDAGTVVELGGVAEITAVAKELSDSVFGVISTCYAYLMNGGAGSSATHPAVAMSGRVPVKVVGKVNKHDRLVSAGNGYARAATEGEVTSFNSIGRALEDKTDTGYGKVLAVVSIK
jgi:hypothetical protein